MTFSRFKHRGFTLVELAIAMTIFSLMSSMVIIIYFHATDSARRLSFSKELVESAREITERISEDITKGGIMVIDPRFDPSRNYVPWNTLNGAGSGAEVLILGKGNNTHTYVFGKRNSSDGLDPCDISSRKDIYTYCGLYLKQGSDYYNLLDSFVPDDAKKRVKIDSLQFFVTGDDTVAHKVTLNFSLSLMPRAGIGKDFIESSKLHIQTTLSERLWQE